jgi:predicted lipoprotein with Yx(FWY)xxD motif
MKFARALFATGACVALTAAVVGCGNSNDSSSTAAAAPTTTASVSLADTGLGQVLVGPDGNTVYMFEKDTSSDASACSGECASAWPPLTTKRKPTAGSGVDGSMLTTFKRDDGGTQIAYNGHPLYYFSGDSSPGDTTGNDSDAFDGEWYAMNASGESVGDDGESSSDDDSSTSTSGSAGSLY